MKDLYTFDSDEMSAHATYEEVRGAYNNFFDDLKVPYLVASADSGAMGGDLSHEYHFPSGKGEDNVHSCTTCGLVRNEEVVNLDIQPTDACPNCKTSTVIVQKAIEVGHTFYLGTRYSKPLKATVAINPATVAGSIGNNDNPGPQLAPQIGERQQELVPVSMGCYGIGLSRLISAVASTLVDSTGLNWPRVMAPFEVVVIPGKGMDEHANQIYDMITTTTTLIDVVLDDRPQKDLIWKLKDADLIGFPILVIVGRSYLRDPGIRKVEVQCRRLGVKEDVDIGRLRKRIDELLDML